MKKIYVTGTSGTGKTTLAKELNKRGIKAISIDEVPGLCFWINKKTKERVRHEVELNKEFINSHDWICDIDRLKTFLEDGSNSVFVLGSASNQDEFLGLFDKILLLQCKPETFISRIESRKDNVFGKDKTAQELLIEGYRQFEDEMLGKGAIPIDVEGPIYEVVEQIINQSNK